MTAAREVRAQSVSASRSPVEDCRGPRDRCRWGRRWRARLYRKRGPNRLSDVAIPCDVSDRNAFAGATVLPDGRAGGGGLDCEVLLVGGGVGGGGGGGGLVLLPPKYKVRLSVVDVVLSPPVLPVCRRVRVRAPHRSNHGPAARARSAIQFGNVASPEQVYLCGPSRYCRFVKIFRSDEAKGNRNNKKKINKKK